MHRQNITPFFEIPSSPTKRPTWALKARTVRAERTKQANPTLTALSTHPLHRPELGTKALTFKHIEANVIWKSLLILGYPF